MQPFCIRLCLWINSKIKLHLRCTTTTRSPLHAIPNFFPVCIGIGWMILKWALECIKHYQEHQESDTTRLWTYGFKSMEKRCERHAVPLSLRLSQSGRWNKINHLLFCMHSVYILYDGDFVRILPVFVHWHPVPLAPRQTNHQESRRTASNHRKVHEEKAE